MVTRSSHTHLVSEGAKVTTAELFLDLVFVYGFTQVTALMAREVGPRGDWVGISHGLLVLALLWWCWTGYSWLGNSVQADEGMLRIVLFVVMALVFVIDITIPEAFQDLPGGLRGPWVFAACYLIMRMIHSTMMLIASRHYPRMRRNVLVLTAAALVSAGLLFVAGTPAIAGTGARQSWVWAAALAIDYLGVFLARPEDWALRSASHFAERHGLIFIVALGESIVSIGVGLSPLPVTTEIIVGSVMGIAVCAMLWWSYFDVAAIIAENVLHHADHRERNRLARDSYTLLHLPMVAGIILLSLGLKATLGHLHDPLHGYGLIGLYGGVSLYLLAHVAFRLRNIRTLNRQRLAVAVLLLGLIPVAGHIPALWALALLTAIMVSLISFEAVTFREVRERVRHGDTGARPTDRHGTAEPAHDHA